MIYVFNANLGVGVCDSRAGQRTEYSPLLLEHAAYSTSTSGPRMALPAPQTLDTQDAPESAGAQPATEKKATAKTPYFLFSEENREAVKQSLLQGKEEGAKVGANTPLASSKARAPSRNPA